MYVLTTANGRTMKFYLESMARLYRNLYGGGYVYHSDLERDVALTAPVEEI